MIHELLSLNRTLFVFDTETTGTNTQTDRIIELGFQEWSAGGLVREWRSLINPGVPIPQAVSEVHGISDETLRGCRVCGAAQSDHPRPTCDEFHAIYTFSQIATSIARGFVNCDFAGKNVRFDLRILAAEMKRAGVPWHYEGARIIDAERLEQLVVPRTLSHLHEKYTGAKHDGAHGAISDVRASLTVIFHQLQANASLPRDLDALHEMQWPGRLDADGKFTLVNGEPTCQFGKHRGKRMQEIPKDYWDWMLQADFPDDVKRLARDAKLGKFPSGKQEP